MALPTNLSANYSGDGSDPSVKLHQQHHDIIHAAVNEFAPPVVKTSAEWSDSTQTLSDGQIGVERKQDGTTSLLVGDGITPAKNLKKFDPVRKGELLLNVRDFGAEGDGTSDDTQAFSAAVDYANGLNPQGIDAADVKGVTIFMPDKRYRLAGAVRPVRRSGVNFAAASENGTTLLLEHNGATFTWGDSANFPVGGGVANVKIEYLSTPGGRSVVFDLAHATRLRFSNLLLANVGQLARLGSATLATSSIDFISIRGYTSNGGQPVIELLRGAGLFLTNCRTFVGGVVAPAVNRTSTMDSLRGTDLVDCAGSWDTIHINGCFFERYFRGLSLTPRSGTVINNIHLANTYFDYHRDAPIYVSAATGGIVAGLMIDNCWFASWEGDGISLNGPGVVRGVHVSNCAFPSAGTHSVKIGPGCRDIDISDCLMYGSNRIDVHAMGIAVLGGSHLRIHDNTIGYDSTWADFPWQPHNGVYVVANLDYYQVFDNNLSGAAGGLTEEAHSAGSKNRVVRDNIGTAYSGNQALKLPASKSGWVNKQGTTSTVHIHGGTVTAIAKNGTTITGMTSGTLTIQPGESFAVTYSLAPSVTRFVHA